MLRYFRSCDDFRNELLNIGEPQKTETTQTTATQSLEKWYYRVPERLKDIPLLSSLEQFEESLPVREINRNLQAL